MRLGLCFGVLGEFGQLQPSTQVSIAVQRASPAHAVLYCVSQTAAGPKTDCMQALQATSGAFGGFAHTWVAHSVWQFDGWHT
jgi:hypothetical protein